MRKTFEATGMAMKPLKSIAKEGNRIRKKAKVSKLQKEVNRKQGEKEND